MCVLTSGGMRGPPEAQHGKLDLTEVEGLADLLAAETDGQRRQALRQAAGGLRRSHAHWRAQLLRCLAHVEALIDFGEEEGLADELAASVLPRVGALRQQLEAALHGGAGPQTDRHAPWASWVQRVACFWSARHPLRIRGCLERGLQQPLWTR
jgi:MnmE helical domain